MLMKQMSVFVENTTGRLSDLTGVLAENNIDIIACTIADTVDFGILRCIVEDPEKATEILKEHGFTASITEVIAVSVEDKPGGLDKILKAFAAAGIGIEACLPAHVPEKAHARPLYSSCLMTREARKRLTRSRILRTGSG